MSNSDSSEWQFFKFGLIVTGKGEEKFLPRLFRSLMEGGHCSFEVICRIGQRDPITSKKRILKMVGSNKAIPDRDESQIGYPARRYLNQKRTCIRHSDRRSRGRSSVPGHRGVSALSNRLRYGPFEDTTASRLRVFFS